jgi:hypothetical protein
MSKQLVAAMFAFILIIAVGWYIDRVAHAELTRAIRLVIQAISLAAALGLGISLTAYGVIAYHHMQTANARAREAQARAAAAEYEASKAAVLVVTAGQSEQVYIRDLDKNANWRPAYLDARLYANGQPGQPSPLELATWLAWRGPGRAPIPDSQAGLPELAPAAMWPERVNLLDLLVEGPSLERIVLGVDGTGATIAAPLGQLVHVAVGGSSGWGKSNFLRALAYQLAAAPEPCQLALIDLEAATFAPLLRSNRLRYAIADTEPDALAVLSDLVEELNRRKEAFSRWPEADRLSLYNRLAAEPLPIITLLIDESTALLSDKAVETTLRTLVLRARKYGIFAILGGQDWRASSLDTAIRNQLSSRIQFKAQDAGQSRVLLGTGEAAHLDAVGRALAVIPGRPRLELQAPVISLAAMTRELTAGSPPPIPRPAAPAPDEVEQQILELARQGNSKSAIARSVLGADGGNQLKRVAAVLEKFPVP